MTTVRATSPLLWQRDFLGAVWRRNAPLAALVLGMAAVLVVALVGLVVDPRVITGAPAWMKPLKFAISIAVYGATLLWMLTFIPERPRLVALVSWGLFIGFALEIGLIVMQVLRGTTSHFNLATPFDAAVLYSHGGHDRSCCGCSTRSSPSSCCGGASPRPRSSGACGWG